jgi:hypothetical protein
VTQIFGFKQIISYNFRNTLYELTGRLTRVFWVLDFQRVFLGVLETASFRGGKTGMLRENGKGDPRRGVSDWLSKLN